jgi:hypothetical protein
MLPGFRFLLAAIVLSMSILVFGLGAAALLRAAHEEVASVPTRRVMAEPVFAHQVEATQPTLALLRLEPAVPEKAPDTPAATLPPEPAPEAAPVPKADAEKLAVLKLDDVAPGEMAKLEAEAKPEVVTPPETAATETPAPMPPAVEPASTETKIAALETAPPPPAEAAPAAPEVVAPPAMNEPSTAANIAAKKTAALSSPDAKVEKPAEAKKADEKSDPGEIKKQQRAERAKERRRLAARRARLAAQQAAAAQRAANPFSQILPPIQPVQPAATRRPIQPAI